MAKQAKVKTVTVRVVAKNIGLSAGIILKGQTAEIPAAEADGIIARDKSEGRKARLVIE